MSRMDFVSEETKLKESLSTLKETERIDSLLALYDKDREIKKGMTNEVNTMIAYLEAYQRVEETKKTNTGSRLDFITSKGNIKDQIAIQKAKEAEEKHIEDIKRFLKEAKARKEMEVREEANVRRINNRAIEYQTTPRLIGISTYSDDHLLREAFSNPRGIRRE